MKHLYGKFVWFEHMSADPARSSDFYAALFGWQTKAMSGTGPHAYFLVMNGQTAIAGLRQPPTGLPSLWMSYVSVPDVDAAHSRAVAAGAKSLVPPADVGKAGRGATMADPTGAIFSVWTSTHDDAPDVTPTPMGDWIWNELMSPDEKKALAFYEGVFGFGHDTMDMGPQGTYYLLKTGEVMRAGLMHAPMPDTPPLWVPYVAVPNCDATASKARTLGAQVIVEPTDIPNVGRFATLLDPQGACIAFMKPFD